jgi:hypothetical protein
MRRLTHITIFLLLLCGCKKDASVDKIDSDIKIKMWETVDSTKRTLLFYCSTEREYGCSNYGISKTFNKSSDNIDIDFNGILVYDLCLTSIGPATTTIDLGTLSSGTYNLDIKVERKKSEGQLIVTSDYYAITLDKQKKLQIINSPLHRIPTNTIWGTVGYHTSSTTTLVQTFIDSLQLLGATAQTYQSGYYGYFQINSSGQILPPQNSGYYFIRPYIFNCTGNTSALKTLVKNYGTNYSDSLSIILYTTKGEIFRSWTQ